MQRCRGALQLSCSGVVCAGIPVQRCRGALQLSCSGLSCPAVVAGNPPSGTPGYPASWLPCTARAFPRISRATGLLRGNGPDHVNQGAEAVILTPGCKNDAESVSAFGGRESI